MSLNDLPTLAESRTKPCATPKYQIPSGLEVKTAADRTEQREERAWRKACIARDGKVCRRCERTVVAQLERAPQRLEVHHLAGRVDRAFRYDVRNGLVVCGLCHDLLTRHRVFILQALKHMFTVGTKHYLNASKPITFSEKTT